MSERLKTSSRSSYLQVPPPVRSPHLINVPYRPLRITVNSLWCVRKMILEHRIPDQLLYAFHRIPIPQLHLLRHRLPFGILQVARAGDLLARPVDTAGKLVNCTVELILCLVCRPSLAYLSNSSDQSSLPFNQAPRPNAPMRVEGTLRPDYARHF